MLIAGLAVAAGLFGWDASARAADLSFSWDGTVVLVDPNGMGAIHGEVVEGVTPFSGFFVYPDACDLGCIVEPFGPEETNYVFPNGLGGLMGGGGTSIGVESSVNIVDDQVVTEEDVELGALLGLTLALGQTTDVWSAASETAGEFTTSFVDWNVEFVYSTSDPFSNTDYVATPPPNPDLILFAINQDDGDLFFALGNVNSVPEPTSGLMLGAGVLGLASAHRARSRRAGGPSRL
jgi:hypothetical protein